MTLNVCLLAIFGLVSLIMDGVLWGTTGCLLYRLIAGRQKNWVYGAIIVSAVYFLWDEIVINQLAIRLRLTVEDESVSALMGDNLFSVDIFDLVISFGTVMFGYWLGQKVLSRILQTNSLERASNGPVTPT